MPHPLPTAAQVEAYLAENPDFLAQRPDLFSRLQPPARVHGEALADHMTAMVTAARRREARMSAQAEAVLASSRAAASVAERIQEALLAALQASDLAECVAETWPGLLGVDAASLCCEGERPRWRSLPRGSVRTLLCGRPMVVRDRPHDATLLHAEAALLAERDLLLLLSETGRPALLALVSRDPDRLPAAQAWLFLGRALARLCEHRPLAPS